METIENIKENYLQYIQQHSVAIDDGSAKVANRIHKKIILLVQKVKNDNQMNILLPFLKHENENVKLWTASIFLQTYPETVLKVLNELTKPTNFFTKFEAKMYIDLYNKGEWEKIAII